MNPVYYAFLTCFVLYSADLVTSFGGIYRKLQQIPLDEAADVGSPLFLTPYIERGKILEGQAAAYVKPFVKTVASYAGFLTVNRKYNSNLFFWYFPSESATPNTPVILWLQGGPGATSLFGIFEENGPFYVDKKNTTHLRKFAWTKMFSMIYIDNPVGTGFSFAEDEAGYSKNQVEVGENLYSAIVQFFKLFPDLQNQDFYIAGESYAGKYVPAAAYTIHTKNPTAPLKINLKGVAIGNGLVDPVNMINHYGDYLYQLGLIDTSNLRKFRKEQATCVKYIEQEKWPEANRVLNSFIAGDLSSGPSLFFNNTGFTNYFNFLKEKSNSLYGDFSVLVQKPASRKKLHVGNSTFHTDDKVETILADDICKSVKPWVETLLEHYKVLIYNGQLDIIVAYPLTVGFLQALNWSSTETYASASRNIWRVSDDIFGYVKTAGYLTEILVRDAGHMVPTDQPAQAFDMISRFIFEKPYFQRI